MSAANLEDLAALRGEIDAIARDASQGSTTPTSASGAVSYAFGLGEIASLAEEKIEGIVESIQQTLASLAPMAHFRTTVDGFTAKTVVSYSGFAASVWSTGTTAQLVDAHLESLRQIYAFRAAVTAVVAAVGNAVVAISVAVGNPLTAWHAIQSAEALELAVERLASAVAAQTSSSVN